MKGLLLLMGLLTIANVITQRLSARSGVAAVSELALPGRAPAWAIADGDRCVLVIVVRNSCPACRQAARRAVDADQLLDRMSWVAHRAAEADSFRIAHPALRVRAVASATEDLAVRAVPAAFLVKDSLIHAAWALRGDESAEYLESSFGCRTRGEPNVAFRRGGSR